MLADLRRTQQGAQMRRNTRIVKTALGFCAALGAALGLVLLLQVTITVGTSAGQPKGKTDAAQVPPSGSTVTLDPCTELAEAALAGPPTGTVGIGHTFTVTLGPADADPPITYFWQATEQLPEAHPLLDRYTDTMQFTWDVAGSQHVTVTASNPCAVTVSAFHTITIESETWYVYLPLALRNHISDLYEPNDTPEQAYGPLVSGTPYFGLFPDSADTFDYYYIDILTLEPIDIHLTVPAQLDLDLWLYRGQTAVSGSGTVGKGIDEALEFTPEQTGIYHILVYRAVGSHPTASYALVARYGLQ